MPDTPTPTVDPLDRRALSANSGKPHTDDTNE